MKPDNSVQIICIRNTSYYITVQKNLGNNYIKDVNINVQWTQFPNLGLKYSYTGWHNILRINQWFHNNVLIDLEILSLNHHLIEEVSKMVVDCQKFFIHHTILSDKNTEN